MALRGLIWDVDGTLCDTLPLCFMAFREAVRRHAGVTLPDDRIAEHFGPTEAGTLRTLVGEPHWRAAVATYQALYEDGHDRLATLFEGVGDVLQACRERGLRQAVVTGKGRPSAQYTLTAFGLTGFFDPVMTGSDDGPVKADCLRSTFQAWQLPPQQVAYVGDTHYDVEAAQEAGVAGLLARWSPTGYRQGPDAVQAAAVLHSPRQLLDWLEQARD